MADALRNLANALASLGVILAGVWIIIYHSTAANPDATHPPPREPTEPNMAPVGSMPAGVAFGGTPGRELDLSFRLRPALRPHSGEGVDRQGRRRCCADQVRNQIDRD